MSPDWSCGAQLGLPWLGDTGCSFSASELSHQGQKVEILVGKQTGHRRELRASIRGWQFLGTHCSQRPQSTAWTRSVPSQQQPSAAGDLRIPVRGPPRMVVAKANSKQQED